MKKGCAEFEKEKLLISHSQFANRNRRCRMKGGALESQSMHVDSSEAIARRVLCNSRQMVQSNP
jgi:hypothetical protein